MKVPEIELRRVTKLLEEYCKQRVPAHVRDKVWMVFRRRGGTFTLFECRPYWQDESQTTESPIARFVYHEDSPHWELKWCDRNDRWHPYQNVGRAAHLETLVEEVDLDPTGIFWG